MVERGCIWVIHGLVVDLDCLRHAEDTRTLAVLYLVRNVYLLLGAGCSPCGNFGFCIGVFLRV